MYSATPPLVDFLGIKQILITVFYTPTDGNPMEPYPHISRWGQVTKVVWNKLEDMSP